MTSVDKVRHATQIRWVLATALIKHGTVSSYLSNMPENVGDHLRTPHLVGIGNAAACPNPQRYDEGDVHRVQHGEHHVGCLQGFQHLIHCSRPVLLMRAGYVHCLSCSFEASEWNLLQVSLYACLRGVLQDCSCLLQHTSG